MNTTTLRPSLAGHKATAARRLQQLLRIRVGEGGIALRLVALMLILGAGFAIGGSGVESLFFARFGPRSLPYLYVVLGVVTLPTLLAITSLFARAEAARLLATVPLALAGVVLSLRGLLGLDEGWSYPVAWVLMMVLWTVQTVALWGLAGAVSDTRQAKRLFPLYGASLILGGAAGGLATAPLVAWVHAENLLLVWAGSLGAGFALARSIAGTRAGRRRPRRRGSRRGLAELAEGFRFVRRSPLLRAMAGALALFAMLYFMLTLPFAEAATRRFPEPDRLAGFLGTFFGLMNGAALVVSLVVSNRLFARFGVATMVLVLPLIYLIGFAALGVEAAFAPLVIFRFVQMLWVNAVWAPGWQALFNVVPPARRGPIRTFMDGGPFQLGTVAAGLVLVVVDRALAPGHVYGIGAAAAAAATVAAWRIRRAYAGAVGDALRAGWPEVFLDEEDPFGGVRRDAAGLSTLRAGLADSDPQVRRMSLEILAALNDPRADAALVGALSDEDHAVRAAALRAVARRRIRVPASRLAPALSDPHPAVRARGVEALTALAVDDLALSRNLGALAADPDPEVRSTAAAALAASGDERAEAVLADLASSSQPSWRAAAVDAVARVRPPTGLQIAVDGLDDPDRSVRRAAAVALGELGDRRALAPLIAGLGDEDATVRDAAVGALVRLGEEAVGPLVEALGQPALEPGALAALARLPARSSSGLRRYAQEQAAAAGRYARLWQGVAPEGDDGLGLLAYSLREKALSHGLNALRATAPLHESGVVELVEEGLVGRHGEQRANALEMLEALGEPEIADALLALWEDSPGPRRDGRAALRSVLDDDDAWLRACAARAALRSGDPDLRALVQSLARSDPDRTVREVAASSVEGGVAVETLSTLPLMERVLFLRKVPLFAELSPDDLKHVAEAATEHVFSDGEVMAESGEPGDEMHIVVSGEIRVVLERDGGSTELARRTPGEYVGEMAIISEEPRMASLIASGPVRTLAIDHARFERITLERPQVSLAVMRGLCKRLRESNSGSREQ